jgi:hypothetical protein
MEDSILSSPILQDHRAGEMWPTPIRSSVRLMKRDGQGYKAIRTKTGIPLSTIKRIYKSETSRTTLKSKATKPSLLKQADIKRIFCFVSESWTNRCKSWGRVRAELKLTAKVDTIRKTMKKHGYRRCVACRRPFISKKQVAKRLAFALKYRWWGTIDCKRVVWSDEATFETGKRGRV